MLNEKIIIVNEKDEIIGSVERERAIRDNIYRVSALWIENTNGDILLAQRSFSKKQAPGKWGPAVSGTNAWGETYETNIIKETEEEIGLSGYQFEKIHKVRINRVHNYFCQWYKLILDKSLEDFKIDPEEVAEIKWFSKEDLDSLIKSNPGDFVSALKDFIQIKV